MSDWKERMNREAQEAAKAQRREQEQADREMEQFIREHGKSDQDKFFEATVRELKDIEKALKVKDIRDQVAKVWNSWGLKKYESTPTNGLTSGTVFHKGKWPTVYYLTGDVDIATGVTYELTHKKKHPGRKGYYLKYRASGPDRSYTVRLETPQWIPEIPARTETIDYSSQFSIRTGKTITNETQNWWVAVTDRIPHYSPSSTETFTLDDSNFQTIFDQLHEFSYQATKKRTELGLLPSALEQRLRKDKVI